MEKKQTVIDFQNNIIDFVYTYDVSIMIVTLVFVLCLGIYFFRKMSRI